MFNPKIGNILRSFQRNKNETQKIVKLNSWKLIGFNFLKYLSYCSPTNIMKYLFLTMYICSHGFSIYISPHRTHIDIEIDQKDE